MPDSVQDFVTHDQPLATRDDMIMVLKLLMAQVRTICIMGEMDALYQLQPEIKQAIAVLMDDYGMTEADIVGIDWSVRL
jgi:hypothetical protein